MRTPGPPGSAEFFDQAGGGGEISGGVLGVDAALDGVADAAGLSFCLIAQRLAGGDADLFLDQVDAGHRLR